MDKEDLIATVLTFSYLAIASVWAYLVFTGTVDDVVRYIINLV